MSMPEACAAQLHSFDGLPGDGDHIDFAHHEGEVGRFELGHEEQVPHESLQTQGVATDHLHELPAKVVVDETVEQELNVRDDRTQRGA